MIERELLNIHQVLQITGIGKSTIPKLEKSGRFPKRVELEPPRRWRREDIENWIAAGCPRVSNK